jgi:LysM repeat protein
MRRPIVAATVLLCCAPSIAFANIDKAGTTAANFLSVGAGAGILGMGGATLGFGGDLASAAWNPAGLGRLDQLQLVVSHSGVAEQSQQDWAAVGGQLGASPVRWALSGLFQGDGRFDGRDASNNPTGSFDVSSSALGIQLARPVGPYASAGIGLKYASENLGGVGGSGATIDAGLSLRHGMFGLGFAAQNAVGRMKYSGASYPFPSSYGLGVSLTHPKNGLRAALDANFPAAYYPDVRSGVEWMWKDMFALRTGYRAELGAAADDPLAGPTFGMGAGVNGLWFDYGYMIGGNGSGQHRIGLSFHPRAMGLGAGAPEQGAGTTRDAPPPAKPTRATEAKPKRTSDAMGTEPPVPSSPATSGGQAASGAAAATSAATPLESAPPRDATPARKPAAAPTTPTASATRPAAPAPAPRAVVLPPAAPAPKPAPAATRAPKPAATSPVASNVTAAPKSVAPPVPVAAARPEPVSPAPVEAPKSVGTPASAEAPKPAEAPAPSAPAQPGTPPVETKPATPVAQAQPAAPPAPAVEPKAPVASNAPKPEPPAPVERPAKVTVKKGETLEIIAKRWGTSAAAIMMENNLVSDRARPGQTLKLPRK